MRVTTLSTWHRLSIGYQRKCQDSINTFLKASLNAIVPSANSSLANLIQENNYVPKSKQPHPDDVEAFREFINSHSKIMVITGAGISTESGVPDYRSKDVGLYARRNHKPIQHQDFIRDASARKRYWARNYIGWEKYEVVKPNLTHYKIKELQDQGKVNLLVTQNVDSLHTKAGSSPKNLIELHGAMSRVQCLNCKTVTPREELQHRFQEYNRDWDPEILDYAPDADAVIHDHAIEQFNVPPCTKCGGNLKPEVVFFGDNVPKARVQRVYDCVDNSDAVLVLGSSLFVWSGYRFVHRAHEQGIPVAAINIGPTRADKILSLKLDHLCSDILTRVV